MIQYKSKLLGAAASQQNVNVDSSGGVVYPPAIIPTEVKQSSIVPAGIMDLINQYSPYSWIAIIGLGYLLLRK